MATGTKHYTEIECLPECDERHADDCPREKAEMDYWAWIRGEEVVITDAYRTPTEQLALYDEAVLRECCGRGK